MLPYTLRPKLILRGASRWNPRGSPKFRILPTKSHPKFEHPGGLKATENFSENFSKIEIETLDDNTLESGTANAVIRHQINGERVQGHHATLGFPFASLFIKALNRDVHILGLSFRNGSC